MIRLLVLHYAYYYSSTRTVTLSTYLFLQVNALVNHRITSISACVYDFLTPCDYVVEMLGASSGREKYYDLYTPHAHECNTARTRSPPTL